MYSLKNLSQLKDELRQREASVTGKEIDLIESYSLLSPTRLFEATIVNSCAENLRQYIKKNPIRAYNHNQNFGVEEVIDTISTFQSSPSNTFRDIKDDVPLPLISQQLGNTGFLLENSNCT